jgi:hypothetical protein
VNPKLEESRAGGGGVLYHDAPRPDPLLSSISGTSTGQISFAKPSHPLPYAREAIIQVSLLATCGEPRYRLIVDVSTLEFQNRLARQIGSDQKLCAEFTYLPKNPNAHCPHSPMYPPKIPDHVPSIIPPVPSPHFPSPVHASAEDSKHDAEKHKKNRNASWL